VDTYAVYDEWIEFSGDALRVFDWTGVAWSYGDVRFGYFSNEGYNPT